MQALVDDSSIFTKVSRSSRFSLLLVGAPRKDVLARAKLLVRTLWIAFGSSLRASGSLPSSLSSFWPNRRLTRSLRYKVRPHHKHDWCGLRRLQTPLMYKHGAHKHRVSKIYDAKLINTRLKPRASTFSDGLTSLRTPQSSYTNHLSTMQVEGTRMELQLLWYVPQVPTLLKWPVAILLFIGPKSKTSRCQKLQRSMYTLDMSGGSTRPLHRTSNIHTVGIQLFHLFFL